MKNIFTLLVSLIILAPAATGQSVVLDSTNLPIIVINTFGQQIKDHPRITVFMGIIDNGPGMMNHVTDSFNNCNGDVSIEIRGSTSQQYPKKSYAFTPLDTGGNNIALPILGCPEETDWILYAPYPDKTLMRNTLAYYLFNRMGHYASRTRFVELILNNDYKGVYELHEKVKQDDQRVDIAKLTTSDTTGDDLTGGYIVKIDKTTGSGDETWTSVIDDEVFFQYHDPEDEDLLDVQKEYIQSYINLFETTLKGPLFSDPDSGFRKYADETSFMDFLLLQETGRTVDGYRSSCFFFKDKDSKGGKLTMGPAWDYNLSFGNCDYCDSYLTTGWQFNFNDVCDDYYPHVPFWWTRLLEDTVFSNDLQCRWNTWRETFLSTDSVHAWIDEQADLLQDAQERNFEKWEILGEWVAWNYFVGETYEEEINYMKDWISDRLLWIDDNLPGICLATSAAAANQKEHSLTIYPNPFRYEATVGLAQPVSEGELIIRNALGLEIKRMIFSGSEFTMHRDDLLPGIYFIEVRKDNLVLGKGTIIVM